MHATKFLTKYNIQTHFSAINRLGITRKSFIYEMETNANFLLLAAVFYKAEGRFSLC